MVAVKDSTAPKAGRRQVVFSFDEGAPETRTAQLRGGKGANLAEMVALGLPVPAGFTVTTTVARAYQEHGQLPQRFAGQLDRALQRLERMSGHQFGNPDSPLLVSVRSGAQASMPGMMDTVLNVGMTPEVFDGLVARHGEEFASDVYYRFLVQFGRNVLGAPAALFTNLSGSTSVGRLEELTKRWRTWDETTLDYSPREQLMLSLDAVRRSWWSERASLYRAAHKHPEWWGTAVNVQSMVFGNLNQASGTGVVFSHDMDGRPGMSGEYLPFAQGEDVVAGTHTPYPISHLAQMMPAVFEELRSYVTQLSRHFSDIVDVEFTVEDGVLYLLQVRRAKRTPRADVTFRVHKVWAGEVTKAAAVEAVLPETLDALFQAELTQEVLSAHNEYPLGEGLAASPGAATGVIARSSEEAVAMAQYGLDVVLVVPTTTPDDLPGMMCSKAFVTFEGGTTCHAAVVARAMRLPAVVGMGDPLFLLPSGTSVTVDGTRGLLLRGELELSSAPPSKELNLFTRWKLAVETVVSLDELDSHNYSANTMLFEFYLTDAMAARAIGTPLAGEMTRLRDETHRRIAGLFAAYLLVAVAGEARHASIGDGFKDLSEKLETLMGEASPLKFQSKGREDAQQAALNRLHQEDLAAIAQFFELCEELFRLPIWGSAFGGSRWAQIAETGKLYVSRGISLSMFVDRVFDLRHNGGVLFNKRPSFDMETNEPSLRRMLDAKARTSDIEELYLSLSTRVFLSRLAQEIQDAWHHGIAAGLWKDTRW